MKESNKTNIKITVVENEELKDENVLKSNLIHLYDVMNDAIKKLPEKERKKYLLSDEKIKQMKQSGNYRFI